MEERDVDLILLEEFLASEGFREWFLKEIGLTGAYELLAAGRSVVTANGESDVEVELRGAAGNVHVLVENKISAPFQDRQAERYRERGALRMRNGECIAFRVVLVAPSEYIERTQESPETVAFDARIPYERIVEWFTAEGTERGRVKAALLRNAFEGREKGRAFDSGVTDFHTKYWKLQQVLAPELGMKRPDVRGPGSSFIVFLPTTFEAFRRDRLCEFQHKLEHGCIDFELRGRGALRSEFLRLYGKKLPPWVSAEKAGKSLALRVRTTRVEIYGSFDEQRPAVEEALSKSRRLLEWIEEHIELVTFGL